MAIDSAAAEAGVPLVVPVGHYVGCEYDVLDPTDEPHRVRRGAVFHPLSGAQHTVWTLAHGTPDAVGNDRPWPRRSVEDLAGAGGLTDVPATVDDLIERGLLVEVGAGSTPVTDFAKAHRVVPLMLGLGPSVEEPDLFGIGFLGRPALQVSHPVYDLWQWSTMDDSLWSTCESAADVARQAGSTDPVYTDPEQRLTGFLGSLHALLLAGAACLDVDFRLGPVT